MAGKVAAQKKQLTPQQPHPLLTRFAHAMRTTRQKRKLSQEALADRLSYSVSYVSMLERGLRNPPLTTVGDIAKALGTAPAVMLG